MSAPVTEPNTLTRQLWQIAGSGDLQQLDELMSQGADVNARDRTGVTALMRAAYHGQLGMVRALIFYGADVNIADNSRLTALMIASHAGHEAIVETLLSRGAKGAPAANAMPRSVGTIADESVGEPPAAKREAVNETLDDADTDFTTESDRTSHARTLHEPLEEHDLVAKPEEPSQEGTPHEDLDDENEDFLAKPDEPSEEETLHESLDENDNFLAKPDEPSQEETLHESLDEYDDFLAKPDEPSQGTLHEPPEIWELVHTTESESGFAARALSRVNLPRLLMLTGALITCAGVVFALFYLRRDESGSVTRDDRRPETVAVKPTSLVRPAAARTKTNESRGIESLSHKPPDSIPAEASKGDLPSAAVVGAIDDVIAAQLTDVTDRDMAMLTSQARKPVANTQNQATNSRAHVRVDAHKVGRSRDRHAEEESTLKEPKKLQTESASAPTKSSNAPKPKVIQWP